MIYPVRTILALGVFLMVLAVGSACGGSVASTGGLDLATLPPDVAARFRFAEDHQSLLDDLPCYCGCGKSLGHRNLTQCFVGEDGTYQAHGAGCEICQGETKYAELLLDRGLEPRIIRQFIDTMYARYGAPTDTP